jgi:hypothetical protein
MGWGKLTCRVRQRAAEGVPGGWRRPTAGGRGGCSAAGRSVAAPRSDPDTRLSGRIRATEATSEHMITGKIPQTSCYQCVPLVGHANECIPRSCLHQIQRVPAAVWTWWALCPGSGSHNCRRRWLLRSWFATSLASAVAADPASRGMAVAQLE